MPGPIGIIANPASGKDIRRLVAHASVFDNQEKRNILRRAVLGAVAAGAGEFLYLADRHGLVEDAIAGLELPARFAPAAEAETGGPLDSTRAAARMRAAGCAVVISLGGDGTNRAIARGWADAPLVAISTGTNNVFPQMLEGTVAGAAAGLIAAGAVALHEVATQAKVVRVGVEGGEDDLALIDAVLLERSFVGARALWEPESLRAAVLARAEPAAVGISALGGLLVPIADADDAGLALFLGAGGRPVRAPIAPGLYREVGVRDVRRLALGETVELDGPGMLAFDGERERLLEKGRHARLRVERDGPYVVDVPRALRLAACRGAFRGLRTED